MGMALTRATCLPTEAHGPAGPAGPAHMVPLLALMANGKFAN